MTGPGVPICLWRTPPPLAVPPKIKAKISWDSVILPEDIKRQSCATLTQEDNRDKIFSEWGFRRVPKKGSGLTMPSR